MINAASSKTEQCIFISVVNKQINRVSVLHGKKKTWPSSPCPQILSGHPLFHSSSQHNCDYFLALFTEQ